MSLIELVGIRKSYRQGGILGGRRSVEVLRGVDLAIEPGRCLGLLGVSGCGKSTTGRLILGLEEPDAGAVLYKGRNLRGLNRQEKSLFRRNSQVVFQNSHGAVNPRFRAWSIVTEPISNFERLNEGELRKRAADLLKKVGLTEKDMDKLPHQFSGGELQRVCVARAIALNPEFIVLDEAVSSLDMLNQSLILDLLMALKGETGVTMLFISHDLRVLLKMSDALAVMDHGRISAYIHDLAKLDSSDILDDPTFKMLAQSLLPAEPSTNGIMYK